MEDILPQVQALLETKPYLIVLGLILILGTLLSLTGTQTLKGFAYKWLRENNRPEPFWLSNGLRSFSVLMGLLVGLLVDFSVMSMVESAMAYTWILSGLCGACTGAMNTGIVWLSKALARRYLGLQFEQVEVSDAADDTTPDR